MGFPYDKVEMFLAINGSHETLPDSASEIEHIYFEFLEDRVFSNPTIPLLKDLYNFVFPRSLKRHGLFKKTQSDFKKLFFSEAKPQEIPVAFFMLVAAFKPSSLSLELILKMYDSRKNSGTLVIIENMFTMKFVGGEFMKKDLKEWEHFVFVQMTPFLLGKNITQKDVYQITAIMAALSYRRADHQDRLVATGVEALMKSNRSLFLTNPGIVRNICDEILSTKKSLLLTSNMKTYFATLVEYYFDGELDLAMLLSIHQYVSLWYGPVPWDIEQKFIEKIQQKVSQEVAKIAIHVILSDFKLPRLT
jgi:hypothetical protein